MQQKKKATAQTNQPNISRPEPFNSCDCDAVLDEKFIDKLVEQHEVLERAQKRDRVIVGYTPVED